VVEQPFQTIRNSLFGLIPNRTCFVIGSYERKTSSSVELKPLVGREAHINLIGARVSAVKIYRTTTIVPLMRMPGAFLMQPIDIPAPDHGEVVAQR
jgi:hypothetical protein